MRQKSGALVLGAAAAAAVLLVLLQRATTFTSDDYYYASFWQDGLWGFVRSTRGHFFSRNGRVLVSLFAAMDLTVYALCCTAMLDGIFLLLFRCLSMGERAARDCWAVGLAAFFLCLLAVDYRVMRSWFLCVSDAFNYIYPLLMIGLLLLCLDREPKGRGGILALSALLAGASTEQGGVMACGLILLTLLEQYAAEKRVDRRVLWALLAAAVGLGTIFLSPATRSRVGAEFSLSGLAGSFVQYANSLSAPGLALNLMVFFACTAGLLPLTGKAPKVLYLGLPVGLFLSAGWLRPLSVEWNSLACGVFFCYLLLAAAGLIFRSPWPRGGFLLLAGLASAGLVMFSRSCSVRVTTPLVLLITVCGVFFLTRLYDCLDPKRRLFPAAVGLTAALVLVILVQVPVFRGVWSNYAILKENEAAAERARTTGVLEYQDYDDTYSLQPLFSNDLISYAFLSHYRLPPDTEVVPTYTPGPAVVIGGQEIVPVVHRGRPGVPLRALDRQGSLLWVTDNFLRMEAGGRTILYHAPTMHVGAERIDAAEDIFPYQNSFYISLELAERLGLLE